MALRHRGLVREGLARDAAPRAQHAQPLAERGEEGIARRCARRGSARGRRVGTVAGIDMHYSA
jgi:hypothetical protein